MLLELITSIENSSEFKSWKEENPEAYLTSAFSMFSETPEEWSVTYFDPKTGKMTSFSHQSVRKQEEIFSKEKTVPALETGKVKTEENSALKAAQKEFRKSSKASIEKTVMVLQSIKGEPCWNITFITSDLKAVNSKVSCSSEEILETKTTNISDLLMRDS